MTSIPVEILKSISKNYLHAQTSSSIKNIRIQGGGCINNAGMMNAEGKEIFVKWNQRDSYPNMFKQEAKGLQLLQSTNSVKVPKILLVGETEKHGFLLMEGITSAAPKPEYFSLLGRQLAQMHRTTNDFFGLDHDNYIGSLPQKNAVSSNWAAFFVQRRLLPQVELASKNNMLDRKLIAGFEGLFKHIKEIFPEEKPAILHGDLWNGNVISDATGEPCLIDPAIYFGFREMDIAMAKLFGGFNTEFFMAYHEAYPMKPGWQERLDYCNLYPLMVHVNLFGKSYLPSVRTILLKFL